jgi:DNA-binding NarL/FixJ family response regulator
MERKGAILTQEERDVLILASVHPDSRHLDIHEISQRLGISDTRVKTIIHQACRKLGADNRNEAVLLAMRQGEINLNELLPLDELATIISSVDPDVLRMIADRVRHNQLQKNLPEKNDQIIPIEKRQPGILTNRERDVLILASNGLKNEEIAQKLCMSVSAVRTFLNRSFKKLGARKKADAVQAALKQREISIGEISSMDEFAFFLAPLGAESIEKLAQRVEEIITNKSFSANT